MPQLHKVGRWLICRACLPGDLTASFAFVLAVSSVAAAQADSDSQQKQLDHSQAVILPAATLRVTIVDPCLKTRWRFLSDPLHPERPGKLVPFDSSGATGDRTFDERTQAPGVKLAPTTPTSSAEEPAFTIRTGDRVTVVQETPLIHARFLAIALEAARVGQRLRVRLLQPQRGGSAGPVVEAQAESPGRAAWLSAAEVASEGTSK